jgi:hypothetical protein
MTWLPFFQWCEDTAIGTAIRGSQWAFPVIESFHLVAFAVLGGTVLIVDLRLMGSGLRRQAAGELAREMQPWLLGSLAMMATTGVLLFLSEAVKCYYSYPFWVKMTSLLLAIVFTFTVRRRVLDANPESVGRWSTLVAIISLVLWGGVAWGGRWIGFSG